MLEKGPQGRFVDIVAPLEAEPGSGFHILPGCHMPPLAGESCWHFESLANNISLYPLPSNPIKGLGISLFPAHTYMS